MDGRVSKLLKLILLLTTLLSVLSMTFGEKPLRIGVIADCQYHSEPGTKQRKYAMSEQKLKEAIEHFNTMDLEYVIHVGDFIDRDFESFAVVGPIYAQSKAPTYHVLGNHDYSVADEWKAKVPETMGLTDRYYDFGLHGWRFVVLDGNELSFFAHPEGSEGYRASETYYQENQLDAPKWNGGVGAEQMSWLKQVLDQAEEAEEKVIIYCHYPVFPDDRHNLWNAEEVVTLISGYPSVKAFLSGHNHAGNYAGFGGVHYLTMKGMVDTTENAYAVIELAEDRMTVTGYGRQEDREFRLR